MKWGTKKYLKSNDFFSRKQVFGARSCEIVNFAALLQMWQTLFRFYE